MPLNDTPPNPHATPPSPEGGARGASGVKAAPARQELGGGEGTTVAPKRASRKGVFGLMLLSSLISLWASLVLSIDAWKLAANPALTLGCDINAVVSCGKVALSWQASLLGFPNAFFGLMAEPVVITIAVASLGGAVFPRWFLATAQVVYGVGLAFAYWLFFQSYFYIGAFCPWCILVTITTTFVFFTLLRFNVAENNLYLTPRGHERGLKALSWGLDVIIPVALVAALGVAVLVKYGPFLFA